MILNTEDPCMSSNDLILLGQLLDQRLSEVGEGLSEDEYFEIFSAEQILKDDDLSYEELLSGLIDGGGDGGIDSFYFFANDNLFDDESDASSFKKGTKLRLVLYNQKIHLDFLKQLLKK